MWTTWRSGSTSKKIRQSPTRRRRSVPSRLSLGARATTFRAGFAATTVQALEELIDSQVFSSCDLGSTFRDSAALGRGGGVDGKASDPRGQRGVEIETERLADELGSGPLLGLPHLLHLAHHLGWQRYRHGLVWSHKGILVVNRCYSS